MNILKKWFGKKEETFSQEVSREPIVAPLLVHEEIKIAQEAPSYNVEGVRNLLVVEDNLDYLAQVKDLFSKRTTSPILLNVQYASTLEESLEALETHDFDGVMCDLFFPKRKGLEEELNGCTVAQQAFDKGLPLVLVTSTYHHDGKTEPASNWARQRHADLIDTGTTSIGKNFLGGLLALGYIIEAKKSKIVTIDSKGYTKGPRQRTYGQSPKSVITCLVNNMDYFLKEGELQEELNRSYKENSLLEKVVNTYCTGIIPGEK
ncbi:response regulator [Candidatus Pacearchaeota archaeon]|nr:response regulator [Candidatus Pacearchaeota archaeon]